MNKVAVILGSNGALGRTVVSRFQASPAWVTLAADVSAPTSPCSTGKSLGHVVLSKLKPQEQFEAIKSSLNRQFVNRVDAVICLSGGFKAGGIESSDLFQATDFMISTSLLPSLVAGKLAHEMLNRSNGLLVLPGANAATGGTSWGVAYGCVKAAVHQLTKSLAAGSDGYKVVAIAPKILDTPTNRFDMPHEDHSTWTPLGDIANHLFDISDNKKAAVNGAVYRLDTKTVDGVKQTDFVPI